MALKQLSPKIKFQIMKRDNFTCQYCGKKPPEVVLHIDHKTAKMNGGTHDASNLTTSCRECNHGKYAEDYKEKYVNKNALIKRVYRITIEQDKIVKKNKKKFGSESNVVRTLIAELGVRK